MAGNSNSPVTMRATARLPSGRKADPAAGWSSLFLPHLFSTIRYAAARRGPGELWHSTVVALTGH